MQSSCSFLQEIKILLIKFRSDEEKSNHAGPSILHRLSTNFHLTCCGELSFQFANWIYMFSYFAWAVLRLSGLPKISACKECFNSWDEQKCEAMIIMKIHTLTIHRYATTFYIATYMKHSMNLTDIVSWQIRIYMCTSVDRNIFDLIF